jgi:phosphoglycerate dehydrogenase-like enzyme
MQAVEFQTTITDGIVQIPKKYKELQKTSNATIIVMYQNEKKSDSKQDVLKELDTLFANSDNKVMLTMDIATDTTGMMDDELF